MQILAVMAAMCGAALGTWVVILMVWQVLVMVDWLYRYGKNGGVP